MASGCLPFGYGDGGGEVGGRVSDPGALPPGAARAEYRGLPPPGDHPAVVGVVSQEPSPERVEALAPLAGRFPPKSPLGRIASQFVAANRLPLTEDVITAYLYQQATRRRRVAALGPISQAARERVLELIDEHWAEHDQGPTWSQLGKQTNLDRDAVAVVPRELKNAGAVTFTTAPGSLRRTPSE